MNEQQPFSYQNGQQSVSPPPVQEKLADAGSIIEWQASEYVHHAKGVGWIVAFCVVVGLLVGLTIWMQAFTFTALLVVMAIAFVIFAYRKPHVMHYRLDTKGIYIQEKFYPYSDFRAFGVLQDGAIFSMVLIPAKRLMPALTMYFEEKDGEAIVDAVGVRLPMEEVRLDVIDLLMRRLRF